MEITFKIDDAIATFTRNWFTGRAVMTVAGQTFELQSPWDPATHVGFKLTKIWEVDLPNHTVTIEKVRPLLLAGFRANAYRIFVDHQILAEKTGR